MNVESWCQVEANSKQSWRRAKRKHFPDCLKSTVFNVKLPDRFDEEKKENSLVDDIQKLRHFKEKCEFNILIYCG